MPIQQTVFNEAGKKQVMYTLDPFAFVLNSIAMGDVIATAPVVKYMIDNFYPDPTFYKLVAKNAFRDFFPFVPDSNFHDFDKKDNFWDIPENFAVGVLNKKNEARIVRNTPKRIGLGQFAGLMFGDRLIPESELNYIPLNPVSVDHFGADFTRAVILVSTYRDKTRSMHANHMLDIARWLKVRKLLPVFVGKTDMDLTLEKKSLIPKSDLPADAHRFGLDLRNKTSVAELASIMAQAKAVIGVDSGPIHLAGTTKTPIICGYTSVSPEFRIPIRREGKTYAIVPDIECIGCESRWRSNYWNYENCYLTHINCVNNLTAKRFIDVLDTII